MVTTLSREEVSETLIPSSVEMESGWLTVESGNAFVDFTFTASDGEETHDFSGTYYCGSPTLCNIDGLYVGQKNEVLFYAVNRAAEEAFGVDGLEIL